jgi:hypothetical protein
VVAELMASAITFKKSTTEKMLFIILNALDMGLTLLALSLGGRELNPLIGSIAGSPFQLMTVKLVIPFLFAWLVPGRLLIPAILVLSFVVGWDIRELLIIIA